MSRKFSGPKKKQEKGLGGTEATPGAAPGSVPGDSRPGGAAPSRSFVTNPKQSLGEIACAFRKDSSVEVTTKPEQGDLEGGKPAREKVDRVAIVSETDKARVKAIVTEPLPARATEVSSVPEPARARKAGAMAKVPAALRSTPDEASRTATSEVIAVRQA